MGVSCASATACTATGFTETHQLVGKALAEAWNGATWSVQATRNPGTSQADVNNFSGVSCTSPTACTAVGKHVSGAELPLAERYSG